MRAGEWPVKGIREFVGEEDESHVKKDARACLVPRFEKRISGRRGAFQFDPTGQDNVLSELVALIKASVSADTP